jgi:hypothetical protein
VDLGEQPARGQHGAPEGGQDRLAYRPRADRLDQPGAEGLEPEEEEVFLVREVVEHRGGGDLGLAGDLGHRHPVEAPVGEQSPSRVGDQLAGLLLLTFAESLGHAGTIARIMVLLYI